MFCMSRGSEDDEDLEEHFEIFGKVRYARVVIDASTERSKGTGFVCFWKKEDADKVIEQSDILRQEDIAWIYGLSYVFMPLYATCLRYAQ